jgi:hypothetical protein
MFFSKDLRRGTIISEAKSVLIPPGSSTESTRSGMKEVAKRLDHLNNSFCKQSYRYINASDCLPLDSSLSGVWDSSRTSEADLVTLRKLNIGEKCQKLAGVHNC